MPKIPLEAALKLLDSAHDIRVVNHPNTIEQQLDLRPDAETFLSLTVEDDDLLFSFEFSGKANETVRVSDVHMTLICDDGSGIDLSLYVPTHLLPPPDRHEQECNLESQINLALDHIADAERDNGTSLIGRFHEIRKHLLSAKESFDWLDNVNFKPKADAPEIVTQALRHVRAHLPEVDRVVFWGDGRWSFMTDSLEAPSFEGKLVDIGLLEDASNAVGDGWPHVYQM